MSKHRLHKYPLAIHLVFSAKGKTTGRQDKSMSSAIAPDRPPEKKTSAWGEKDTIFGYTHEYRLDCFTDTDPAAGREEAML
jgi:hypothetical protein